MLNQSALFTDLYELTMAQAYNANGFNDTAVFELLFRRMPKERQFVMIAGLDDILEYLENFYFTDDELEYLRQQGQFGEAFLNRLKNTRFTGDVYAVPEGTILFPNEPLIQIIAPVFEAQLIETYLLNQAHFQSVAASKAARLVLAGPGKTVVDFGSRRSHGTDAALKTARATYLAGCAGTSNVLAGKLYGIPIYGTMAHSYVQSHETEYEAFKQFAMIYPNTTILVDTYDTLAGVKTVIKLLENEPNLTIGAVRLDSGDLFELSKQTRQLLDISGHSAIKIFVSSNLDEYAMQELLQKGAPIDGFGIGTKLAVSEDAPHLDFAYKLVEYAGKGRTKLSADKVIYPGRKQIYRVIEDGKMVKDVVAHYQTTLEGEPLLQPVMKAGKRLNHVEFNVTAARKTAQANLALLPDTLKTLHHNASMYPVEIHSTLEVSLTQSKQAIHVNT